MHTFIRKLGTISQQLDENCNYRWIRSFELIQRECIVRDFVLNIDGKKRTTHQFKKNWKGAKKNYKLKNLYR